MFGGCLLCQISTSVFYLERSTLPRKPFLLNRRLLISSLFGDSMKSVLTGITYLGVILVLGGGFLVVAGLSGEWIVFTSIIGAVVLFIGLLLILVQYKISAGWNKVVDIISTHEQITIQEASGLSGLLPEGIRSIIFEAIELGDLTGTFDGETFSKE